MNSTEALHLEYPPEPVYRFPPPEAASDEGIVAIGGAVNPDSLLSAYSLGIFPWYSQEDPIIWWNPDPRFVLFMDEFHMPRSLARVVKKGIYRCTFDRAFDEVIFRCAGVTRRGQQGTWITDEILRGYTDLHRLGWAHSVEVWDHEDRLCGGLYGVSLGRIFFGESMFHLSADASKAGFAFLVEVLKSRGFNLIDCQDYTDHLARFGSRSIPRAQFLSILNESLKEPTYRGSWRVWEC